MQGRNTLKAIDGWEHIVTGRKLGQAMAQGSPSASIYMNSAAEGWPKAPGVAAAMSRALELPPASPGRVAWPVEDVLRECRQRIAGLLDVPDPHRIVLACSATHALNLAIHGLGLRAEALVVTTVTEHNSVLRPLWLMERSGCARVIRVGLDAAGALDLAAYEEALSGKPRLVAINHASNVTGRINPVERLFALAKAAGAVTLLDASQTAGQIPVHPLELGADLVVFPGHKGLHGPAGTGALFVAPGLTLDQILVGGTGRNSRSSSHPEAMPERLEAGTPNLPGIAGFCAALAWHADQSERFLRQAQDAGRRLRNGLRSIPGVKVIDDEPQADRLNLISFLIEGWPVDEIGIALQESFGITCRTGLHCAPLIHEALGSAEEGTVRLSTSGFNTEAEVLVVLSAIAELANSR